MTVAEFVTRFPFFQARSTYLVESALATAARMYSVGVCGDYTDDLVGYQAAVFMLTSPKGGPTSKTAESGLLKDYQTQLDALKNIVKHGPVVAACPSP